MNQMVTRCPKCATAFRITSTQLESAKGAVRCGSCLHIFKAQDYLVKTASDASKNDPVKPAASEPTIAKAELAKPEPSIAEKPPVQVALIADEPESTPIKTAEPAIQASKPTLAPFTKPEYVTVTKPVIDKAKVLEDEDDVLISDDMDSTNEKASTYEFDGFLDLDLHPKQTVSLFEREIRYEPPTEDNEEESEDESWAEELLDDDGEPLQQLKKPAAQPKPIVEHIDDVETESSEKPDVATASEGKYSGPIFSIISENQDENNNDTAEPAHVEITHQPTQTDENKDEPFFSEAFLNATRPIEPAAATESSNFAAALFTQEADVEEDKSSSKRPIKSSKMRAFDTSRASLLMNIMPAPVEFTARRMRRWYQKKIWPTLAIVMCVLFFFQLAYFKFDYFSRVEPYRTAYLFICPVLGCEVPSLVDTSQILATNLIVRNHPDIANALMVDAILINNAPFEQPFPDLILSFSKLDETPVASRRFTPKEYLAGELAGMKYIPQRQPVHITLEISDPGPDAVNYSLATH